MPVGMTKVVVATGIQFVLDPFPTGSFAARTWASARVGRESFSPGSPLARTTHLPARHLGELGLAAMGLLAALVRQDPDLEQCGRFVLKVER